jgi:hypothetical protein
MLQIAIDGNSMSRLGKASLFVVLVFVSCSDGSGTPAIDDSGEVGTGTNPDASVADAGETAGVAAGSDFCGILDGATCDDAANMTAAFTIYPSEIRWSGPAGYGASNTIRVRANVDLTDLSATFSSGGSMAFANNCSASLASGQTCTVSVTTCLTGYSAYQESGEVVVRTGGEHGQSLTVPVHANCYSI